MRKVLNVLKKKELDVLILVIVLVSSYTLLTLVNFYDETWNFANCYKMFNGYKIYQELNVIVTPLFFYIAQLFFKIFGANLLAFRIYNIVIFTVFFMLIYFIFKSLKIVRRRAILYTFLTMTIFSPTISNGANYNILAVIPILIAILLIIKEKENSIFLGILLFLTFMIKQNIFVYFAIGIFIYKLINKQNIKKLVVDLTKIYLITFIGISIFLIYMYFDNNLYNFIDYCFLGINEFGTYNQTIDITGARYIYISLMIWIFNIIIIYNKKINKDISVKTIKNIKILLSFGIPLLLTCFPIVNYFHSTMASVIIFIEFVYILENILINKLQLKRKTEKVIYVLIIFMTMISVWNTVINTIRKGDIFFVNNGILMGCFINENDYHDIEKICNYIKMQEEKDIDVKILSYKANLYMIHLNKNNGIFDLAFLGNFGGGGENELINQISKLTNALILVKTNEEENFWQESRKAREYIIDNYKKVEEISEYSVYYIQ